VFLFVCVCLWVCNTKRQQNIAGRYLNNALTYVFAVDRQVDIVFGICLSAFGTQKLQFKKTF